MFLAGRQARKHGRLEVQTSTTLRKDFCWMHNEDAMATDKLAEGIRKFNSDAQNWKSTRSLRLPKK
jgi:transaldolase